MGVHRDLYGSRGIRLCRELGNRDILPSLAIREARMSRVPSYYATPNRLKTPEQMQALLKERTKRNQAATAPSDAGGTTPTPRGSLPNSLGTHGRPVSAVESGERSSGEIA